VTPTRVMTRVKCNSMVLKTAKSGDNSILSSFLRDQEVVGSNPVISTSLSNYGIFLRKSALFCRISLTVVVCLAKSPSKTRVKTRVNFKEGFQDEMMSRQGESRIGSVRLHRTLLKPEESPVDPELSNSDPVQI